jgi:hypothetical protein
MFVSQLFEDLVDLHRYSDSFGPFEKHFLASPGGLSALLRQEDKPPAGRDGRSSYRKKGGLGVFSPPRQPALEELVIQVDDILEEL